jgi:hypothetical protein
MVAGHMNILENRLGDKAAKRVIELQKSASQSYISLAFIKRKIKEFALDNWTKVGLNLQEKTSVTVSLIAS